MALTPAQMATNSPLVSGIDVRMAWHPASELTRVEQLVQWFVRRIDDRILRAGTRLPSIREFSREQQLSKFTVVEAFDRLVARGYVQARPGSGYYVKARDDQAVHLAAQRARHWAETETSKIDVVWLLRNMFRKLPTHDMPGGGVMPGDWLDEGLLGASLRALARQNNAGLVDYGSPQGYLPLRQQLSTRFAELGILASAEQLLTTSGVTQGLDLVAQHFLAPGEVVFVDDPSWFVMFGRFAQLGAKIIGIPRNADGPDLVALRELAQRHRPKMFVVVSVLHNPSSTSMSAANAFQVLKIAEEFDFMIVEDDVYGDLHPGAQQGSAIRLAALDQLKRVVYLTGFSKTLAANLRVGVLAGAPALVSSLTDRKMLVGLTTSEIGERMVYRILSEGHYRRHLERLRGRLDEVRDGVARRLESLGLKVFAGPQAGMFLWAQAPCDSNMLARDLLEDGFLLAPGSLFHPDQRPSQWMRFNIATSSNPKMLDALSRALQRHA